MTISKLFYNEKLIQPCQLMRGLAVRWRHASPNLGAFIILFYTFILADILGYSNNIVAASKHNCFYYNFTKPWMYGSKFEYIFNHKAKGNSTGKRSFYPDNQCLIINSTLSGEICRKPIKPGHSCDERIKVLRTKYTRLPFCDMYDLYGVVGNGNSECGLCGREQECQDCLKKYLTLDAGLQKRYEIFLDIFKHIDCKTRYSIKWKCKDCKTAYKQWLCSQHIPYHIHDQLLRPCPDNCEKVEETCPYLLPNFEFQYAGEPGFLCTDAGVPQAQYNGLTRCYKFCYFNDSWPAAGHSDCIYNYTMTSSASSPSRYHLQHSSSLTMWLQMPTTILAHLVCIWLLRTFIPNMGTGLT